jgi:hypothetical protein
VLTLVINHSVENCGVYQYGKRIGQILETSNSTQFLYVEVDNFESLLQIVSENRPRSIIFNHLNGTMPWLTPENIQSIKAMSISTFTLVHNVGYAEYFDGYFHQDPNYIGDGRRNFPIPRPLFENYASRLEPSSEILQIGSFGFGFKVKHFDDICKLVDKQFKNNSVQVNLHVTESFFSPNASEIDKIERKCRKILKNRNHRLVVSKKFLTNNEVLDFLSKNHLNVFLYEKYASYNGISSTLDYALSAKRPFAINKSNMFSHFHDTSPSICIEDLSLYEIMQNGLIPLQPKFEAWSNRRLIAAFEDAILRV